jgi:AraC family transcriptional regulator of arabinose operon
MKDKSIRKRDGFEGQQLMVIPKKLVNGFLTQDSITSPAYITDIGYYPKARFHYAERPKGISQHIIIYCVEGSGWIEVNKKRTTISPSQVIVVPANTPHRYAADEQKPWTIYWVHFKGNIADGMIKQLIDTAQQYVIPVSSSERRFQLFDDIYKQLEQSFNEDTFRFVSISFAYFLSSLVYRDKFDPDPADTKADMVKAAINVMRGQIGATLTLPDLASSANLSISHFSDLFRNQTGFAPIEYYNHLKIQKACQYLSFSSIPIKEVALKVGIADQYYFSRMFTRSMGISPAKYRKRM